MDAEEFVALWVPTPSGEIYAVAWNLGETRREVRLGPREGAREIRLRVEPMSAAVRRVKRGRQSG